MCEHLEAVSRGEIKKLLINIPAGCTKSMTVGVFWPAWEWGPQNRPDLRYISASYEASLSIRDNVRSRDLMNGEWYQSHWRDRFEWKGDQKEKVLYENTRSGWRFAASVRGAIIGRRGDRIIIDDPHNLQSVESDTVRDEAIRWFAETLPTRVNDPDTTPFVVIMQRVHERDISGFILAKELGYEHLCLPMEYEPDHPFKSTRFTDPRTTAGEMLWPERFSREAVEDQKQKFRAFGGTYAEAGQFQQRPAPRGGGMFQRKDFRFFDEMPANDPPMRRVRGWDLASSEREGSAYSVGLKMSKLRSGTIVVEDVRRGRWSSGELYEQMARAAREDGGGVRQSIPQDPGQAGKDQTRHFAAYMHGANLTFSLESGSKVDRARPFAAQCEGGNVYLLRRPWNDDFLNEACSFPRSEFMDQVDAASRAYMEIATVPPTLIGGVPKIFR